MISCITKQKVRSDKEKNEIIEAIKSVFDTDYFVFYDLDAFEYYKDYTILDIACEREHLDKNTLSKFDILQIYSNYQSDGYFDCDTGVIRIF